MENQANTPPMARGKRPTTPQKRVIAKPQPTKTISIKIDTTKDPYNLLADNIDIFTEELVKKIKEELFRNSNLVRFDVIEKNGVKKAFLSVKLLSSERSHFPIVKAP